MRVTPFLRRRCPHAVDRGVTAFNKAAPLRAVMLVARRKIRSAISLAGLTPEVVQEYIATLNPQIVQKI